MSERFLPTNTESPDEIITALCNREGDVTGLREMRYRGVVLDVWRDMNLFSVKYTKRILLPVDKRTNSITSPCDFLFLSSLSRIDDCNKIVPMAINNQLHDDIIDLSLDKDCHCECQCKSTLCGQAKYYEPIVEVTSELMPDATFRDFQSSTRKKLENGILYIERTFPVRVYGQNNAFEDVILQTETEEICQFDTEPCGCVKDTKENADKLNLSCNADTYDIDCGRTTCATPVEEGFNFDETGSRLILPSGFTDDKALLRYYAEADMKNLRVPLTAKEVFINGLKAFTLPFDEKQPANRIALFTNRYETGKGKLFTLYNRYSIRQLKQVLNPKIVMP